MFSIEHCYYNNQLCLLCIVCIARVVTTATSSEQRITSGECNCTNSLPIMTLYSLVPPAPSHSKGLVTVAYSTCASYGSNCM